MKTQCVSVVQRGSKLYERKREFSGNERPNIRVYRISRVKGTAAGHERRTRMQWFKAGKLVFARQKDPSIKRISTTDARLTADQEGLHHRAYIVTILSSLISLLHIYICMYVEKIICTPNHNLLKHNHSIQSHNPTERAEVFKKNLSKNLTLIDNFRLHIIFKLRVL